MPLSKHIILGIHISRRNERVDPVQHLLTEYGCSIRTRLGLHEAQPDFCSANGLILLEMADDLAKAEELMDKLNAIEGVEVQKMLFGHA